MRKLLKFILILVVVIILIVGIPLVILFIMISDDTDNAPVELYSESITVENQIDDLMTRFTDNQNNEFYLSFNEEDLNLLIFAVIRDSVNTNYYSTNGEKYIEAYTIPNEVFFFGGKEALVKHVYADISDDGLTLYLTMDAFGVKTNLNIGFTFTSSNGVYKMTLNKFGLGGLNLMSGLGKNLLKPTLSMIGFSEEDINKNIEENNLPIEFEIDDFSFSFKKEDLGELVLSQLGEDAGELEVVAELVDVLSSKDNNILEIGLFEINATTEFGVKLSLDEIENSDTLSTDLNNRIDKANDGFDMTSFITNKTQTFLISNLTGTEQKIKFTNLDFDRIIYDNTNGYEGFNYPDVIETDGVYIFRIKGILFEFKTTTVDILFVIEINGVESLVIITGEVETTNDGKEVRIILRDTMNLADLSVSSKFVLNMLGDKITDFGGMQYDGATKTFLIKAETFEEFMSVGGGVTPLTIEKLRVVNGGLEVVVETAGLGFDLIVDSLTGALENVLADQTVDTSILDTSDPAVANLETTLDDIAAVLNDPTGVLTEELTNQLIDNINALSPENQVELFSQFEGELPANLSDLYNDLFGN